MRPILFLCLLLPSLALPARGQAAPKQVGTWLDLGLGGGNTGLNAGLAITRRSGIHGLTVRGTVAAQIRIAIFEKASTRSFADLGLLYGLHGRAGSTLYTARAGISAIWYHREYSDSTPTYDVSAAFGVPWEVGVTQVFGNSFGLGVRLAGNLNAYHNNIGALLVLHLGQVW